MFLLLTLNKHMLARKVVMEAQKTYYQYQLLKMQ